MMTSRITSSAGPSSHKQTHLPPELWLLILTHTTPRTLWLSLRLTSRHLHSLATTHATTTLLPAFTLALVYSLGAGASHRWYDVRATMTLAFSGLNRRNTQYAKFEVAGVHPEGMRERAREKWGRLCREGFGEEVEWRVRFAGGRRESGGAAVHGGGGVGGPAGAGAGAGGAQQTWRVLFGIDEPADFGYMVKMRQLVVGEDDAVWVDWRELLGRYFAREESRRQVGNILTPTVTIS